MLFENCKVGGNFLFFSFLGRPGSTSNYRTNLVEFKQSLKNLFFQFFSIKGVHFCQFFASKESFLNIKQSLNLRENIVGDAKEVNRSLLVFKN